MTPIRTSFNRFAADVTAVVGGLAVGLAAVSSVTSTMVSMVASAPSATVVYCVLGVGVAAAPVAFAFGAAVGYIGTRVVMHRMLDYVEGAPRQPRLDNK